MWHFVISFLLLMSVKKCKGKNKTPHHAQNPTLFHRAALDLPRLLTNLTLAKVLRGSNFASSLMTHICSSDPSFIAE